MPKPILGRCGIVTRPSSSPLSSLHLRLDSDTHHLPYRFHLDSWILHVVSRNVESLSLTFSSRYLRHFRTETETPLNSYYYYPFPLSLLRNGTVRSLELKHCNLDLPMSTSLVRFDSLTSVVLDQVYLTDNIVSGLVSWCLNLEALSIRRCQGMRHVKVSSPKLKTLDLWQFRCDEGSVEIRAPNLSKLLMSWFEVGVYLMEEFSSLEEADVTCISVVENYRYWSKIVRFLRHVKRFCVQNWWYKIWEDIQRLICLALLYLRLATEYTKADLLGIAVLLELSPKLGTMILDRDLRINEEIFGASISEEFERITFNLPSLRLLKLNCYWGSMDELHFLSLVLKSEAVLERIVVHPVRLNQNPVVPIVLVKQTHGFQVGQGSFSGCGLQVCQGMYVYQGMEIFGMEVRSLFGVAIEHGYITFLRQ